MILKSQIILYMYDELVNHREIIMNDIINKYGISVRTFRRYIAEINSFLCNTYKNQAIVYNSFTNSYYLNSLR